MARLNLLLLAVLTACALGLVTSQHQARKRWTELEREQARTQALEVEYGRLQLEASTLATPARVERFARDRLHMHPPGIKRLQVTVPSEGPAR
jgi:cell division protein FtsL